MSGSGVGEFCMSALESLLGNILAVVLRSLFRNHAAPTESHRLTLTARRIACSRMSIRFQCGNCSQPIEIDDQWASKAVACPYCRKTVTAPAESTLKDLADIPLADPLTAAPSIGPPPAIPHPHAMVAETSPNRIAVVAMALSSAMVLFIVLTGIVASSHQLEMEAMQKRIIELEKSEGTTSFSAAQQASAELLDEYGGMPPQWMMGLFVLYMCAGLTWIAALVCALVGMRRVRRRRLAIAALAMTAVFPLLFCCGGFLFSPGG